MTLSGRAPARHHHVRRTPARATPLQSEARRTSLATARRAALLRDRSCSAVVCTSGSFETCTPLSPTNNHAAQPHPAQPHPARRQPAPSTHRRPRRGLWSTTARAVRVTAPHTPGANGAGRRGASPSATGSRKAQPRSTRGTTSTPGAPHVRSPATTAFVRTAHPTRETSATARPVDTDSATLPVGIERSANHEAAHNERCRCEIAADEQASTRKEEARTSTMRVRPSGSAADLRPQPTCRAEHPIRQTTSHARCFT